MRRKQKACAEVGILSLRIDLPATSTESQLQDAIDSLNADPAIDAILLQLPLPAHLDEKRIMISLPKLPDMVKKVTELLTAVQRLARRIDKIEGGSK